MVPVIRAAILAALLCAAPLIVQAQESVWRPVARQCADEINRRHGCAACDGFWPQWSQCTIERVYGKRVPQWVVQSCISQTRAKLSRERLCAACVDPVRDVIECVVGSR